MANRLTPTPDGTERAKEAERRRAAVAALATSRPRVDTTANDELDRYATHLTNFHKGLPHSAFGIVDEDAFQDFVGALNRDLAVGTNAAFVVPLGPREAIGSFRVEGAQRDTGVATFFSLVADGKAPEVRNWESPLAGYVYSLQEPDAGAVGVAPAPRLPCSELCAEMAEIYAMALLCDVPLAALDDRAQPVPEFDADGKGVGNSDVTGGRVFDALSRLSFLDPAQVPFGSDGSQTLSEQERRRREARFNDGAYTPQVMFRGSTVGEWWTRHVQLSPKA